MPRKSGTTTVCSAMSTSASGCHMSPVSPNPWSNSTARSASADVLRGIPDVHQRRAKSRRERFHAGVDRDYRPRDEEADGASQQPDTDQTPCRSPRTASPRAAAKVGATHATPS
jgi:hypothetical protein